MDPLMRAELAALLDGYRDGLAQLAHLVAALEETDPLRLTVAILQTHTAQLADRLQAQAVEQTR
jgi:hypothetical protein